MFSRPFKLLMITAFGMTVATSAAAQEIEDFKTLMSNAAAMTKQDLSEALRQYLEIRVKYSGQEVDYSLGRAYQRLGACSSAQHYYTQVMVKYKLSESNQIYQRAVQAFDEIAECAEWQKFKLQCEIPAGGYVLIDDERIATCWERPISLPPGKHTLIVSDGKGKEEKTIVSATNGKAEETVQLAIKRVERVEVVKEVEVTREVVVKERFSPHLYWGLIAGGAVLMAGSGFFSAAANNHYGKEVDYAYQLQLAKNKNDGSEKKFQDKVKQEKDSVNTFNNLSYTFAALGGAAAATGIVLAIVSAVSKKEHVEAAPVAAFASPSKDGVTFGVNMHF